MMRLFSRLLLVLVLISSSPAFLGCSSQLSEKETPVVASDEDASATPANDPENP